jgi:Phosphotransferase enzyme family
VFRRYKHYQEDISIINEINNAVAKCVTEWYGSDAHISSPTPKIKVNRNSFFIIYDITHNSNEKTRVFLKIRRQTRFKSLNRAINSNIPHENTRKEYETLIEIYNFFKDKGSKFDAIRPLAFFDKWHAMAIEECESVHLDKLLHHWPFPVKIKILNYPDLFMVAQNAGSWLAIYHREMQSQWEKPSSSQNLSEEIREILSNLSTASNKTLKLEQLQTAFFQKIDGLSLSTLPVAIIHGDFKSENILITHNNQICVIDFKPTQDTIYYDLGQFLVDPDTYKVQIFTFGRFFSKGFLKEYHNAILKGYFKNNPFNQRLVNLYCAINLMEKWTLNETIINNYKDFRKYIAITLRPIMRHYFYKLILTYLAPEIV